MLAPFTRVHSGHHYTIDRSELIQHYHDLPVEVCCIGSPSHIVAWEIMRKQHGITDPNAVPCDLFVWGIGKPPDRRLTRIGGIPWLPKSTPWPTIEGTVLSFLCQFDFRDSRDLVGELPGDLLLIFVAEEKTMHWGDAENMRFLWVSADDSDVIETADAPDPSHPFDHLCAWGVRYRTEDMPSAWDQVFEWHDAFEAEGGQDELLHLPVHWGTKIGGVPYDSQGIHRSVPENYLCQLVSIQPIDNTPWPWINQERPLAGGRMNSEAYLPKNQLMIGDMGEMTFYLQKDGSISVESACG